MCQLEDKSGHRILERIWFITTESKIYRNKPFQRKLQNLFQRHLKDFNKIERSNIFLDRNTEYNFKMFISFNIQKHNKFIFYTTKVFCDKVILKIKVNKMYCCCLVTQPCPTLWDPTDCSPTGSSVPGILQARILEWVAISFSNKMYRKGQRFKNNSEAELTALLSQETWLTTKL